MNLSCQYQEASNTCLCSFGCTGDCPSTYSVWEPACPTHLGCSDVDAEPSDPPNTDLTADPPAGVSVGYRASEVSLRGHPSQWLRTVRNAFARLVQDRDLAEHAVCLWANKCRESIANFLAGDSAVSVHIDEGTTLAAAGRTTLRSSSGAITPELIDLAGTLLHELMHLCDKADGEWSDDMFPMPTDHVAEQFAADAKRRHGF